jgi:hypothetical protein
LSQFWRRWQFLTKVRMTVSCWVLINVMMNNSSSISLASN